MDTCPNHKEHTKCPSDYLAWITWANKKVKTHQQLKCWGCGLYKIWVPKKKK